MTADKIRSNVYLDRHLKEEAKRLFKEYGMSFSDGINLLLRQIVARKEVPIPKDLEIETVLPDDPDYRIVEKTRGEETVSLDEFLKA